MQATASLMWTVDAPEAILRLLLDENEIDRAFDPPEGFDTDLQGERDESLLTFKFKRRFKLIKFERERDYLYVEYQVADLGKWAIEIEPEDVHIYRL